MLSTARQSPGHACRRARRVAAQRLGSQQRAALYGEEADIPPTPAPTTGAWLWVLPERRSPRPPSPRPPLFPGGTRMGSGRDTHRETQASEDTESSRPPGDKGWSVGSALLTPHSRLCGKGETQGGFFLTRRCVRKAWGPLRNSPCTLGGCGLLVYDSEHMRLWGCRPRSPALWTRFPLHGQRQPSPGCEKVGRPHAPHRWRRAGHLCSGVRL